MSNLPQARPGLFDSETEDKIVELALDPRMTLKKIRDQLGLSRYNFNAHVERSPRFAASLARARNESLEELADSLLTIVDEEPDPLRARLKSENIRWILSKRKPQTYGDKLDINLSGTIDIAGALAEARNRANMPTIPEMDTIDAEYTVNEPISLRSAADKQSVDDIFS